jgi:hypothetical protein
MAKELKRRIVAEFSAVNKAKGETAAFRRDMDRTGQAMKRMAMGALASVGGLYALKRSFDYVTKAAMKQQDALFLLEAALKAAGEYTVGTMKGYEAFAASIQQATIYGDEEVLALMQLMKSLGVTSNALEKATKMAIGLAAATGRDVRSMSMYIALAQQGEFTMLRRYIPALRSTTDATEQLRIITEFAARGFEIAKAKAETASGSLKQMWNAVSDLAEIMGQPFIDTMAKDAEKATTNIQILTEALKKHREAIEESIRTEGRMKYMPIGQPFAVPIVSKDVSVWYEKPTGREKLAGQLADQAWAMKEFAKNYAEVEKIQTVQAEQADAMQKHRMKMLEKEGNLQEMEWRRDVERITLRMEAETEARKKAAGESIKIAEETAERRKRIAEDIALSMASSWTDALDQMLFESKKFWDAIEDMARSLLRTIISIIMYKTIAEPMAYGVMGLPVPGGGGGVPAWFSAGLGGLFAGGGMPTAGTVPAASGATMARYQYGGIVQETGPAWVHKGEEITPPWAWTRKDNGGGLTNIEIHNEGSEKLEISEAEIYALSDERILHVTMRAMESDGPYRRGIKKAGR